MDKSTTFTPGPWIAVPGGSGQRYPLFWNREWVIECDQPGQEITVGDGEADARLIAAAPCLAAALCRLLTGDLTKEAWDEARAALSATETQL